MNNMYKFSDLIVNLDDVSGISDREIVYRNGEKQVISRAAADDLQEWFTPSEKRWRESLQEHSQPIPPSKRAVCPSKRAAAFRTGKETPQRSSRS